MLAFANLLQRNQSFTRCVWQLHSDVQKYPCPISALLHIWRYCYASVSHLQSQHLCILRDSQLFNFSWAICWANSSHTTMFVSVWQLLWCTQICWIRYYTYQPQGTCHTCISTQRSISKCYYQGFCHRQWEVSTWIEDTLVKLDSQQLRKFKLDFLKFLHKGFQFIMRIRTRYSPPPLLLLCSSKLMTSLKKRRMFQVWETNKLKFTYAIDTCK